MDDKRNLLTAVLLSALILVGWTFIADRFFPQPKPAVTASAGKSAAAPGTPTASATSDAGAPAIATPNAPGAPASADAADGTAVRSLDVALNDGPRVLIETPRIKGSINLTGARVDDIVLLDHRQTVAKSSPPVRLFAPGRTKNAYFAEVGWTGAGAPSARTLWTASGTKLTPTTPVALTWANGAGQTYRIDYSIDANYMLTAKQSVTNSGTAPVALTSYALVNRLGKSADPSTWAIHVGPMGVFDNKVYSSNDYDYADIDAETKTFQSTGGWIGFTEKYWLAAVIPAQTDKFTAQMTRSGGLYQTNFARPAVTLAPGTTTSATSHIYAGAKELKALESYEDKGFTLLSNAIDWGWFAWFEKPIFYLLNWLFSAVGNFGVAIILLTFIIRGLMFPIAQKQFRSMAQMRVVQPKMKAIQDKYKDDKARQQQEMMKLYQQEKINPMAGCLPILLQIPVFYALYKVLMLAVEMRHQPFVGWIRDLSAPDPATFLNLFGLLPFQPPAFLAIGVLALLLGVTMWLQFRLNPTPVTDPIQKQVFGIMPWMMMFIMAPFASGLLLYWITNNILTIAQQKWLYRQYPDTSATPAASQVISGKK